MIRIERKYKKMIDYLICDVENDDKEDLKQDLLLKLITLLNSKKKKIINNDNYIFIVLKNEKNSKLKHYNHKFLSLENFAEEQISIKYEDEYDYLFQLFISNLQFFWSKLNMKEKIIVFNYYFKNLKRRQIAKKLNIEPSVVSRLLLSSNKKIKDYFIKQKDHIL